METLPQPSASTNGGGPPPALRQPSTTQSLLEGQQPQQPDIAQPSREHLEATTLHIAKLKADYSPERMLPNVPAIDVPAEQRKEYNNVLEQLHRGCTDLDQNLPMIFALIKNEVIVRRLIVIVQTAIQQRAMIFSGSSRFLVTFETLRTMLEQVHIMNESFGPILANLMGKGLIPGDPTATFANKSPCPA
ncbi:hypothetical protein K438DRAFT_795187 [Mycena galopus ATCC 62051]|nr:hypothetical protein K438DRAFT_795187 [Mycena galopus ATCC 62051]